MECSLDLAWDYFKEKVKALQDDVAQVFTTGKRVMVESMHLTVLTLMLKEEEVTEDGQPTEGDHREVHQSDRGHSWINCDL